MLQRLACAALSLLKTRAIGTDAAAIDPAQWTVPKRA
jgi:hypothetical protein